MTHATGVLFDGGELRAWLAERRARCESELASFSESDVLEQAADELAKSLLDELRVEPIVLHEEQKYAVDDGECDVWGPGRLATERVRVHTGRGVPGRQVTVHVPFSGDRDLLYLQPSSWGGRLPHAQDNGNELLFPFQYPSGAQLDIETATATALKAVDQPYLQAQVGDLAQFNAELERFVNEEIANRRQRILEARQHLDGLRIPVYRREDAPKTYAAPGIERRPAPVQPRSSGSKAAPMEPTLVDDFYRHIVEVITAMARGMERNPGDYASWTEEKLRDVLLVILNTHYKGQATGETFNKSGRTDVLVRVEDRNVFVDECKWWTGATQFAGTGGDDPSALDQLLGYTTWRDAKLALTIFVGRKDMPKVIESARDAIEEHPAFVSWNEATDAGQLRCRVRLPDAEQGAELAVIFVHLPRI